MPRQWFVIEHVREKFSCRCCLPAMILVEKYANHQPLNRQSARTTNAIERLHEEFKRRIKTQTVLPSADTAAMLFWALLASGQINMRKIDGWQMLATKLIDPQIDLAA